MKIELILTFLTLSTLWMVAASRQFPGTAATIPKDRAAFVFQAPRDQQDQNRGEKLAKAEPDRYLDSSTYPHLITIAKNYVAPDQAALFTVGAFLLIFGTSLRMKVTKKLER